MRLRGVTLILLLAFSVAVRANETGLASHTFLAWSALSGGQRIRITWGGAEELYHFLTDAAVRIEGGRSTRLGEDVICQRETGSGAPASECRFWLDGEGRAGREEVAAPMPVESLKGLSSSWVHEAPFPYIRLKFSSDIATHLIKNVLPLENDRIRNLNHLRCGKYVSRHGHIGALVRLSPRCFVAFTSTGKAILADTIPSAQETANRNDGAE